MTDYERGVEQASTIYKGVILGYKAENTKLREELEQWNKLTAGIELPGYPITQFQPKDLERENAELRGLVQKMMRFMEDGDWCTTCEVAKECDAQEQYEEDCLMRGVFHDRMRELFGKDEDDGSDLV